MNSDKYDSRAADPHDQHFRLCLSQRLRDPAYGNVQFVYKDGNVEGEEGQRLFTFSHVWEHPAFADCGVILPDLLTETERLIPVFQMS
jgi:hypothetical protein